MKVLAITQARSGSTRLPGKILKEVNGVSLLEIHLNRLRASKQIDQLLVATTTNTEDDILVESVGKMNLPIYRGSVNDVLDRFYQAAKTYKPTWIVRLTSDCPLIDPQLVDTIIEHAISKNLDYCSNTLVPTFPDGMDVEVFKASALENAATYALLSSDREHVTPYIYKNSTFFDQKTFSADNYRSAQDYSEVRLTVDEQRDFEVISLIIQKLGTKQDWKTYADFYLLNDQINALNKNINRNEGYTKSLNNDSKHDK